MSKKRRLPFHLLKVLLRAYRVHWFAVPAAAIAAIISSCSAAALMLLISPITHGVFTHGSAILANSVIAPLLAYVIYLATYYAQMYRRERHSLLDEEGQLSETKLRAWFRVVKYDYLAHVPSDTYLITLAAIAQGLLESQGTPIFWAVLGSQFVDDLITFLKEPAIWGGAKGLVAWESREETTLLQKAAAVAKRRNDS